jgi:hypothetical protein
MPDTGAILRRNMDWPSKKTLSHDIFPRFNALGVDLMELRTIY